MQARYYDPVIGRFYSNDPVGFNNVHNFNRYAYANNNPYKYTDPDGNNAIRILARLVKNPVMTYRSAKRFLRENGVLAPLPPRVDPNPGSDVPLGDPISESESSSDDDNNQYSKGGKQRTKDTGLAGFDDEKIKEFYDNSEGKDRKRYEKELKSREKKNKSKDRTGKKPPPKKKEKE